MKYRLAIIILFSVFTNLLTAQESINAGGGTATGAGGVVTFTAGQSTFTVAEGTGGSSSAGVQQAYVVTPTGTAPLFYGFPIKVFPNPTAHLLQIDAGNAENLRYELTDATGKRIQTGKLKNGKATLNMASAAPGNYQLVILYEKKVQRSFNVLKNSL
ncbi:MAG: T9SS type A sorting domain-containing protein [Sphingomonadales bacterium]